MQGKSLRERSAELRLYVGIDVCSAWLDVYLHPLDQRLRVANDPHAPRRLSRRMRDSFPGPDFRGGIGYRNFFLDNRIVL
jgi:hypothetical protein